MVSIETYSFPYGHAFGVDDAPISYKQPLARAKRCSRSGSFFLSTKGSLFVIAEAAVARSLSGRAEARRSAVFRGQSFCLHMLHCAAL